VETLQQLELLVVVLIGLVADESHPDHLALRRREPGKHLFPVTDPRREVETHNRGGADLRNADALSGAQVVKAERENTSTIALTPESPDIHLCPLLGALLPHVGLERITARPRKRG